jgi:diacylglycerol kinase family enzyme
MPTLADACGGIETARSGKVDLVTVILRRKDGTVRRCRAVASVAVGWPQNVAASATSWTRDLGAAAYPAVAAVLGLRPPRFEASVSVDGGRWVRKSLTGLLVGNTRHLMGVPLFPAADPCDGRMEVLETGSGLGLRALHALATAARVYLHIPVARAAVTHQPARRLSVLMTAPHTVAVDGEPYQDIVRIELRVLRGGLRLFMPIGREP